MGQITYRGRVFSNDDTSHLFVTNNKGQKIKLEMQIYKYFMWNDVNVGNLWVSNDPKGIGIEGRDSKRRSVINNKFVDEIISFVDNPSKTDVQLSGEETISLKKKNINESNLKEMLKRSINEMKKNMRRNPVDPYDFDNIDNEDIFFDESFLDQDEINLDDRENMDFQIPDFEYDQPEGYASYRDDDDKFQSDMRMKSIKGYKPASGARSAYVDEKPYNPIKPSDRSLKDYLATKQEESYVNRLVKKIVTEANNQRYMFFSNLEQIKRQCDLLIEMDENMISQVLEDGHDWAQDHIATAKESIDQVFDFFMNESKTDFDLMSDDGMMTEGRKKAGTKLCARGKAAAKAKFKVWPSAYGNGFAVQVCQGRMKGLDGKKRCSPPYC
jgi:hypothetical protein